MLNTQRDMSSPSGQLSNPKDQNSIGKPVLFKLQAGIGQILLPLFVRGCTLLIMIGLVGALFLDNYVTDQETGLLYLVQSYRSFP